MVCEAAEGVWTPTHVPPSDFNQQDLSTSLSLKPRIGYSFTEYISGDIYFNYIYTDNKTTGSKKERDFGFNIRIKIKGWDILYL